MTGQARRSRLPHGRGTVAVAGGWACWSSAPIPRVWAQLAEDTDPRFAGLRWQFTRIRYEAHNAASFRARYWSDSWAIDGPAAEQNLSRRLRSVTAIDVGEPIVVRIEDPELFNHPWVYFVEPGTLRLKDTRGADPARVPAARRHGGDGRLPRRSSRWTTSSPR